MGMKHTATLAEESMGQLWNRKGGEENVLMIQAIMKNGIYLGVKSVIIASCASPTESIPTKLTIQKITKPAEPNLGKKVRRGKGECQEAHFLSKSTWNARLTVE